MIINDSIKYRKGRAPNIINADDDSYVIVGSRSHGHRISEDSIDKLVNSLKNVVALKMEGDERMYEELHPLSTEVVVKTSVGSVPTSYFPESDKEDLGKKLLKYNVPEEMVEIYIPLAHIRLNDGVLYNPDGIPLLLLMNKKRFFFIDPVRAEINFSNICNYWADNKLNKKDLLHFSFDFEKFLGDIIRNSSSNLKTLLSASGMPTKPLPTAGRVPCFCIGLNQICTPARVRPSLTLRLCFHSPNRTWPPK